MPPDGVEFMSHDEVLRNEEFVKLIDIFAGLGVTKVRFTGGEPLIRKGLIEVMTEVRERHPELELCVTTNGTLLAPFIEPLYNLKVKKLNVSLDTLSRERYAEITGGDYFDTVMANIEKVLEFNFFDLKINSVLYSRTLEEVDAFLDYFPGKDLSLRFIEMMPFSTGVSAGDFVSGDVLIEELAARGTLTRNGGLDTSVALMYNYTSPDGRGLRIGVIPPVTHKFCSTCNRLRITSDGCMKTCLHSGALYPLKDLLRNGADEQTIIDAVRNGISQKGSGHDIDCWFEGGGGCYSLTAARKMSGIGG
jgi:cyclic pyranopterin phosphate synthase